MYRYDPRRQSEGENPFQLDSKRIKGDLKKFLNNENRFKSLTRGEPERAEQLQGQLADFTMKRHARMTRNAMEDEDLLDFLKNEVGE